MTSVVVVVGRDHSATCKPALNASTMCSGSISCLGTGMVPFNLDEVKQPENRMVTRENAEGRWKEILDSAVSHWDKPEVSLSA